MMSETEFANKIREKYPDGVSSDGRNYADISDVELTQKIIEKYPVYKDQVKISTTKKIGDVIKNVGIGAAKGAASTLQNIAKPVTNIMENVSGQELGFTEQELEPKNTAQKIGKGAEQIAEFIAPAASVSKALKAASPIAKIAGQVASDVAVDVAQEGGDTVQTGATSFALSSLPFVSSLLGKYSKVGETASKIAQNLEQTNLRLTPVQRQQLEKQGEDVVKFITEKKIAGTPEQRFEKISEFYDQAEQKVQGLIKGADTNYSKEDFKKLIAEIPQRYATTFDNPEVYNQLLKLSDELVKYADNFGDTIPLSKVNDLKRSYFKNAFNKAGDQVTNEARLAMGETLYKDILENVPALKEVNQEYAKLIQAKKLLGKAIGRNELGLIGNLLSMGVGGAVGSVAGPIGAAIGTAVGPTVAQKVAGTEARSLVSSNLQKLSDYIKTVKPDEAGNLVIPKSIIQGLIGDDQ